MSPKQPLGRVGENDAYISDFEVSRSVALADRLPLVFDKLPAGQIIGSTESIFLWGTDNSCSSVTFVSK